MLNKVPSVAEWKEGDALLGTIDLAMDCIVPRSSQDRANFFFPQQKSKWRGLNSSVVDFELYMYVHEHEKL